MSKNVLIWWKRDVFSCLSITFIEEKKFTFFDMLRFYWILCNFPTCVWFKFRWFIQKIVRMQRLNVYFWWFNQFIQFGWIGIVWCCFVNLLICGMIMMRWWSCIDLLRWSHLGQRKVDTYERRKKKKIKIRQKRNTNKINTFAWTSSFIFISWVKSDFFCCCDGKREREKSIFIFTFEWNLMNFLWI